MKTLVESILDGNFAGKTNNIVVRGMKKIDRYIALLNIIEKVLMKYGYRSQNVDYPDHAGDYRQYRFVSTNPKFRMDHKKISQEIIDAIAEKHSYTIKDIRLVGTGLEKDINVHSYQGNPISFKIYVIRLDGASTIPRIDIYTNDDAGKKCCDKLQSDLKATM